MVASLQGTVQVMGFSWMNTKVWKSDPFHSLEYLPTYSPSTSSLLVIESPLKNEYVRTELPQDIIHIVQEDFNLLKSIMVRLRPSKDDTILALRSYPTMIKRVQQLMPVYRNCFTEPIMEYVRYYLVFRRNLFHS